MLQHFQRVYREGTASWDTDDSDAALRVRALLERKSIRPGARVLDIGCGTGRIATLFAAQGMSVVGIDYCTEALEQAAARARESAIAVQYVLADVMRLPDSGISGPFDVLFDAGCFHSLAEHERADYAQSVASVAAPDATFYMYALGRSTVTRGPVGASRDDIEHHLDRDWELVAGEDFVSIYGEGRRAGWYSMRRRPAGT